MTVWSGIYAKFGNERKDLITEANAKEFRDWLAVKGVNISFISDSTLNGDFMGPKCQPFLQWEIRLAFIKDAEAQGISVYRDKETWESFVAKYRQEAHRYYG